MTALLAIYYAEFYSWGGGGGGGGGEYLAFKDQRMDPLGTRSNGQHDN